MNVQHLAARFVYELIFNGRKEIIVQWPDEATAKQVLAEVNKILDSMEPNLKLRRND